MRHSPTHEEIHDKKAVRSGSGISDNPARHRRSSFPSIWTTHTPQHAAERPSSSRGRAEDPLAAARSVVAPFIATVRSTKPGKAVVTAGLLSCLGLAAMAQSPTAGVSNQIDTVAAGTAARMTADRASRSSDRAAAQAQLDADAKLAAKAAAEKAAAAKANAKIKPVAWLNQKQMDNAQRIVNEGKRLGMPRRAWIAAVACAMQESRLLNLASAVLSESYKYPHEGTGSDHDSVGLFQQRPSSGWGSVKNLMTPAYAARQFYNALTRIPGWQSMRLTYAIQAVQVSAFPEAYAQHEATATAVVNAITK